MVVHASHKTIICGSHLRNRENGWMGDFRFTVLLTVFLSCQAYWKCVRGEKIKPKEKYHDFSWNQTRGL